MKWQPKDAIASIVLIACFVLLAFGIDGYISSTITLIVGYYFGRRLDTEEKIKSSIEKD